MTVLLGGYGFFYGTTIGSSQTGRNLSSPVDAWLGIDYATQPVGDQRFRPATPPSVFDGVRAADTYGKACVQDPGSGVPLDRQDEACLNSNVFRTANVSLDKKLPVLVWIHGGSFCTGRGQSFDGPSFVAASESPVMVVTFNYRLNSLGSLPSSLFQDQGLLNLGLRDQRLFLEFVQDHVSSFGGDPGAVTLGGNSAGAHAVGMHYFHHYGDDADREPLFARAIQQSGSVTARSFPNATSPLYLDHFREYMEGVGCQYQDGDDKEAAMACLRAADISVIRDVSSSIYRKNNRALTWPFQPVQGGPLLEKFGSQSGLDETFYHVPVITTTTTDEGKLFIPQDIQDDSDFLDYLHNLAHNLNDDDMDLIDELYPDPVTDPDSRFADSPKSTQYNRLAAAYSDYAYICPSQETAYRTSLAGVPTWKARFNTNNNFPSWQGIPHTADARYTWGAQDVQYPEVSSMYHAYFASFVTTGDPNKARAPGSPAWPRYYGDPGVTDGGNGTTRRDISTDGKMQLLVQAGETKAKKDNIRAEACLYWRDPARASRLCK